MISAKKTSTFQPARLYLRKPWLIAVVAVALAGAAYYAWQQFAGDSLPAGIAAGNGRVEATEIDIATKIPGRIKDIMVDEGDFVSAGQVLAQMDVEQLEAQRREAQAQLQRAVIGIQTAQDVVTQRKAERTTALAVVAQRQAELDGAERRLGRSSALAPGGAVPKQMLDDDRARFQAATAAVAASQAQVAASDAAISAANSQVVDAQAATEAARATIQRIQADINDSTLKAPRDGRVQYRVAQQGEVLAAGGRVLSVVDLSDVYMTFFLPAAEAGRVPIGADVRLVLDAAPQYVIPAKATFVADVAQFTPKTVETEEERQKLVFRVKAQIPPDLLRKHIRLVKTGLPGMAYVQLEAGARWPSSLKGTLMQ